LERAKAAFDNPISKLTAANNMYLDVFIFLPFLSFCPPLADIFSRFLFADSDVLNQPFIANHIEKIIPQNTLNISRIN
jgi:hypothetical protein